MRLPWRRRDRHTITDDLIEAAARNAAQAADSEHARAQLTASTDAQQDQIRRNHLGEMMHAALNSRRRHP